MSSDDTRRDGENTGDVASLTLKILGQIRDEARTTNQRLDATNQRLDGLPAWNDGLPAWNDGLPAWNDGLPAWNDGLPAWNDGLPAWNDGLPAWKDGLPARPGMTARRARYLGRGTQKRVSPLVLSAHSSVGGQV